MNFHKPRTEHREPFIYVASSWRNPHQPEVVKALQSVAMVYDFRDQNSAFSWKKIDPEYETWTGDQFTNNLKKHPLAVHGYQTDLAALKACQAGVMVLPCGSSSHIEFGYFAGQNKPTAILHFGKIEPELMYGSAELITDDIDRVVRWVELF